MTVIISNLQLLVFNPRQSADAIGWLIDSCSLMWYSSNWGGEGDTLRPFVWHRIPRPWPMFPSLALRGWWIYPSDLVSLVFMSRLCICFIMPSPTYHSCLCLCFHCPRYGGVCICAGVSLSPRVRTMQQWNNYDALSCVLELVLDILHSEFFVSFTLKRAPASQWLMVIQQPTIAGTYHGVTYPHG